MPILGILASAITGNLAPTSPVAGYKLWLDASDTATITASGGAVSQWADKSAFGRNFTQGTGANQPTTGTRTINGKNVIDFDGTNDTLSCPSSTSFFNYLHNSTGGTTFYVGFIDATVSNIMWQNGGGSSATVGIYQDFSNGSNFSGISNGNSGLASATSIGDITLSTGVAASVTQKWDGNNATAANRLLFSKNGAAFVGSNIKTQATSGANANSNFTLGSWDGVMAEIIFYEGILSSGDIALNQSYLAAKWGL
jgi:hypothetical protein